MSIKIAPSAEEAAHDIYVVRQPRAIDALSDALHTAFGDPETGWNDFTALLRKIDCSDRARSAG